MSYVRFCPRKADGAAAYFQMDCRMPVTGGRVSEEGLVLLGGASRTSFGCLVTGPGQVVRIDLFGRCPKSGRPSFRAKRPVLPCRG